MDGIFGPRDLAERGRRQHQRPKCHIDEWVSRVQPNCTGFPDFTDGGVEVEAWTFTVFLGEREGRKG